MMSCRVMARIWARPGCLTTACPPRPSGDVPIAAALQHRHGGARTLLRGKLDILGKTGRGKRLARGAAAEDGRNLVLQLAVGSTCRARLRRRQIRSAHVCTPVTTAHVGCRLMLDNKI